MIDLIKGDCLQEMQNIPDKSIDAIICDLPYGTTQNKWDSIINLDLLWSAYKRVIKDNGVVILTASQPFTTTLIQSNLDWFKYDLVWHKRTPAGVLNAKKMPLRTHEQILFFYKNLPTYNPIKTPAKHKCGVKFHRVNSTNYRTTEKIVEYKDKDMRYPTSVVDITGVVNSSKEKVKHPTQKPIKLMEWLVKTYTNKNETVLDNTMGSGTTAIACMNTNRNFIGIELDEHYFAIAKKRVGEKRKEKDNEAPTLFSEPY